MRRLLVLLAVLAVFTAGWSAPSLQADDGIPIDMGGDECVGIVPHLPTEVDRGPIKVDVVVALDGVSVAAAKKLMWHVLRTYKRSGAVPQLTPDVKLNVIAYHDLTGKLKGNLVNAFIVEDKPKGSDLMSQLIRYYRAKYPKLKRHDVHLLTKKDIAAELVPGEEESAVLGIANCIGGIGTKYAYAISEVGVLKPIDFGPFTVLSNLDSKVAAHEIGHVFGAHHHYAHCAQAPKTFPQQRFDPCTLMFNDASLISHEFGPVEVASIRGYTEAHVKH